VDFRYGEGEERFLVIEAQALRYTQYRHVTKRARREPRPEASVATLFGTELNLRIMSLASDLLGPEGCVERVRGENRESSKWLRGVLAARASRSAVERSKCSATSLVSAPFVSRAGECPALA
jgi:hypothetical protein